MIDDNEMPIEGIDWTKFFPGIPTPPPAVAPPETKREIQERMLGRAIGKMGPK